MPQDSKVNLARDAARDVIRKTLLDVEQAILDLPKKEVPPQKRVTFGPPRSPIYDSDASDYSLPETLSAETPTTTTEDDESEIEEGHLWKKSEMIPVVKTSDQLVTKKPIAKKVVPIPSVAKIDDETKAVMKSSDELLGRKPAIEKVASASSPNDEPAPEAPPLPKVSEDGLIETRGNGQIPVPSAMKGKCTDNWVNVVETATILAEDFDSKGVNKPFTLVDLSMVRHQLELWKKCLPSVKPYYAVKCNDASPILKTLLQEGCGFDCASQKELQKVLNLSTSADIILAHPIKTRECINFAVKHGITRMTFDCMEELMKMTQCAKNVRPILRMKVPGFNALVNLNTKYGADEATAEIILKTASNMNILISGISFHIGSGVEDYRPMQRTIAAAKKLVELGRKLGHPMDIVDIGGGFLFSSEKHFEKLGYYLEKALNHSFKRLKVTVVAEPGRYLVSTCQFAVAKVVQVAPKTLQGDKDKDYNVWINDGAYGSFNYVMTEQREAKGIPLKKRHGTIKADIWGPTCCSFDIVEKNRKISTLREGDWLIYPNNGAYANVLATEFNGFERPARIYLELQKKD